jgi:hypothetical protein
MSCTTTELLDSWKSPELETRLKIEQQIKTDLEIRGIHAMMSLDLFDASLRTEKMTKEELKVLKNKLTNDGFDAVLLSKVIGVEDKIAYKKTYRDDKKINRNFKEFSTLNNYYNN